MLAVGRPPYEGRRERLQREAGITDYKFIEWYREQAVEADLKLLAWNDAVLGGKGFVDWFAFDHPQLGPVELGGWDSSARA